jgi:hypothetical protein
MSNISSSNKVWDEDKSDQGKGVRCYECQGFGHIKIECPTYLKKQKNRMSITWSESDDANEGETSNKAKAYKHLLAK